MPKDTGLIDLLDTSTGPVETLEFYDGTEILKYDHALHAYYQIKDGQKVLCPGSTTVCGCIDKSGPLTQWAANMTVQYLKEHMLAEGTFVPKYTASVADFETLLNEARFNYRSISKDATDVGTMAHNWLEEVIKARIREEKWVGPLPGDSRAVNCINAAIDWMERHDFTPIASEFKIFSREFGYAGTADFRGWMTTCGDTNCCGHPDEDRLAYPVGTRLRVLGDFKSSKALYDEYRAQLASYRAAWEEEHPDDCFDACVLLRLGKEDGDFETVLVPQDAFEADFVGFLGTLQMYYWMKQLELDRKFDKEKKKAAAKALKAQKASKGKVKKPKVHSLIPVEGMVA